jgi:hypothetical protein
MIYNININIASYYFNRTPTQTSAFRTFRGSFHEFNCSLQGIFLGGSNLFGSPFDGGFFKGIRNGKPSCHVTMGHLWVAVCGASLRQQLDKVAMFLNVKGVVVRGKPQYRACHLRTKVFLRLIRTCQTPPDWDENQLRRKNRVLHQPLSSSPTLQNRSHNRRNGHADRGNGNARAGS